MGVVNDPLYQIRSGQIIFENFSATFGMWCAALITFYLDNIFDTFGKFSIS